MGLKSLVKLRPLMSLECENKGKSQWLGVLFPPMTRLPNVWSLGRLWVPSNNKIVLDQGFRSSACQIFMVFIFTCFMVIYFSCTWNRMLDIAFIYNFLYGPVFLFKRAHVKARLQRTWFYAIMYLREHPHIFFFPLKIFHYKILPSLSMELPCSNQQHRIKNPPFWNIHVRWSPIPWWKLCSPMTFSINPTASPSLHISIQTWHLRWGSSSQMIHSRLFHLAFEHWRVCNSVNGPGMTLTQVETCTHSEDFALISNLILRLIYFL